MLSRGICSYARDGVLLMIVKMCSRISTLRVYLLILASGISCCRVVYIVMHDMRDADAVGCVSNILGRISTLRVYLLMLASCISCCRVVYLHFACIYLCLRVVYHAVAWYM